MSGISNAAVALFLAGTCGSAYGQSCNGQWLPVLGPSAFDDEILSMTVFEDSLVAGGPFDVAPSGAAKWAAAWNGAAWTPMNVTLPGVRPQALTTFGGQLHAGGIGSTFFPVASEWDGAMWVPTWQDFPPGSNSRIFTFGEYQEKLVVAGDLRIGIPKQGAIWLWDGAVWSNLGAVFTSSVRGTAVYEGELYVTGDSRLINNDFSMGTVLRYDGTTWRKLGPNGIEGNLVIRTYHGKLYIAGSQVMTTGAFSYGPLASWDGTTVERVGSVPSLGASVGAMTEYEGDLIIAGSFLDAFNVGANSIVRFDGTNFATLGSGLTGSPSSSSRIINTLAVYKGELLVGGTFLNAGNIVSPYFARWTDNPTPWVAIAPQSKPVNEGLTLTLNAAAASGYEGATYKWQRNGADIADGAGGASAGGGTVSGASGSLASPSDGASVTLTIEGVQASDAGDYTVAFDNTCNAATSSAATVTVNTCPGDLNADSFVNDTDFGIFATAYDILMCDAASMPIGCLSDWNGDGVVDDADFQIFVPAYNELVCE